MKQKKPDFRSHCPTNYALDIFGDKWSLLIIRDLMFKGKKYYSEFLVADEKVSTNILADRLIKLEKHGLIFRSDDEKKRSRIVYNLTDKGKNLLPMMLEMISWSAKYDIETEAPASFIRKFKKDKRGLVKEILSTLSQ